MTATPIPRTISMTLFGDLDVTTLREMPPGRQEVQTYVVAPGEQPRWWNFVREKLRAGRQAFLWRRWWKNRKISRQPACRRHSSG